MNKKSKNILALSVLSILFGILLSLQKGNKVEDYKLVSLNSIQTMKNEIENSQDKIECLNNSIYEKNKKLRQLKKFTSKDESDLELYIEKEIDDIKLRGGLTDVVGSGIEIIISDNEDKEISGENINDDIIHDSEIQLIINDLKNAGAEAISINNQRIVYRSEVKCGGPIIRINETSSANPFTVKVIGEPKSLYSSVTAKESFGWMLKEVYNKNINVEIVDQVFISKYNWLDSSFKHAIPIKEGD